MMESTSITHVYCVPGMSAKPTIFEHLRLPETRYKIHWLSWISPCKNESVEHYAKRLCADVHHEEVILIGVSLGGVVAQEMQKFIRVKQIVLISTIKTKYELPAYMRFGRRTKLYKLLPSFMAQYLGKFENWPLGRYLKGRLHIYNRYMGMDQRRYLNWAIEVFIYWDRETPLPNLIHIHGSKDNILPIKFIKNCYVVNGATHLLIINRFRWLNENLPRLLAARENSSAE